MLLVARFVFLSASSVSDFARDAFALIVAFTMLSTRDEKVLRANHVHLRLPDLYLSSTFLALLELVLHCHQADDHADSFSSAHGLAQTTQTENAG